MARVHAAEAQPQDPEQVFTCAPVWSSALLMSRYPRDSPHTSSVVQIASCSISTGAQKGEYLKRATSMTSAMSDAGSSAPIGEKWPLPVC